MPILEMRLVDGAGVENRRFGELRVPELVLLYAELGSVVVRARGGFDVIEPRAAECEGVVGVSCSRCVGSPWCGVCGVGRNWLTPLATCG